MTDKISGKLLTYRLRMHVSRSATRDGEPSSATFNLLPTTSLHYTYVRPFLNDVLAKGRGKSGLKHKLPSVITEWVTESTHKREGAKRPILCILSRAEIRKKI